MTEPFRNPEDISHSIRDEMVALFLAAKENGEPLSGEHLSQHFGLSRTAIWKHIKLLESVGFAFAATTRVGYRLTQVPDELMQPLVKPYLPAAPELGHTILWAPERASTNDTALELARAGAAHGVVVTARQQTGGRGRQGRPWVSPVGGMWQSIIVRNPCALSQAADLTLLASVAVQRALKKAGADSQIKWPNDILLNHRKICGILAQMRTNAEQVEYAVIGIGINANFASSLLPETVADHATTLVSALGRPVCRPRLLADILQELATLYGGLAAGQGFAAVRDEWKRCAHTLGRRIQVRVGDRVLAGIAEDVDAQGVLHLRDEHGELHRIHSGEVLFSQLEQVE